MIESSNKDKNAWAWVPSLYFTEGLPYVIVITVSVIMYKKLGVSNADIGIYTSWLYLPWVLKPLWSPLVDIKSTKRNWFLGMQLLIAIAFLGVGLTIPTNNFFILSLSCFWIAAFASATHDIAADGYYLIGLSEKKQSFFLGVRSTFYRLAMITGQGLIVVLAGFLEEYYGNNQKAWSYTITITAVFMVILTLTNFFTTPKIEQENTLDKEKKIGFFDVFSTFFQKKQIGLAIAFILMYRLGESQLVKMASPFLLDQTEVGGLALSTTAVGTIYGTFGLIALTIGGILGGIVISMHGLKKWMLPMILALNLPNLLYALLAFWQPSSTLFATLVVIIEQFGYGFGFAAYLMFMIYVAEGVSKTSHYAIATGFMALGMMLPGMVSGIIQEAIGYTGFFIWVAVAAVPGIILTRYIQYPNDYGKKDKK
ncbi:MULTISPECIES: MFS transporter [Aquimarina]|uniref:AmpG family muropeptide MFS transporter n=1 Tax=Aquimarina algiphila TaxID=2047982 RepID=A0A554VF02_9FLAO|nr:MULTISPECIES: MFS transporter [Aquimarina]TSE05694.1 AmpG family muropeptide MFS transporter [Aquimarina algiphila]